MFLVKGGVNKDMVDNYGNTPLHFSHYGASHDHLEVVRYLVEQGSDMEKVDNDGNTPLLLTASRGLLEVARYLLEQGANRDKANNNGDTPLHLAAIARDHWGPAVTAVQNCLETAKLLMAYGADLNARNNEGQLPIDVAQTEAIKQAIRDEPRRRMDHGHKRATEQDRHPNAAASASAQPEEEEEAEDEEGQSNKLPRLEVGEAVEGKVAEEDEDSEPSSHEEDND